MPRVHPTFDISEFKNLTSLKSMTENILNNLNRASAAAVKLDNRENVYASTVEIRKQMQKIMQKAEFIRYRALMIRKRSETICTRGHKWCPNPDYAFTISCTDLGSEDSCNDEEGLCALCLKV